MKCHAHTRVYCNICKYDNAFLHLLHVSLLVSCHSFYSKRYSRALYLGAKAIQLNSNSVQALLLKGAALRNMGRVQEAIIHFREAMRLAPCRLDCYEGMFGFSVCYLFRCGAFLFCW